MLGHFQLLLRACPLHKTFQKVPGHRTRTLPPFSVGTRAGRSQTTLTWRENLPEARRETKFCPPKLPAHDQSLSPRYFQLLLSLRKRGGSGAIFSILNSDGMVPLAGEPPGAAEFHGTVTGSISLGGEAGLLSYWQSGDSTNRTEFSKITLSNIVAISHM